MPTPLVSLKKKLIQFKVTNRPVRMTVSQDVVEIKFGRVSLRTRISQNMFLIKTIAYPTRPANDPTTIFSQLLLDVALSASPRRLLRINPKLFPIPGCPVSTMWEQESVADLAASFRIDSRSPMKREKSNKRGIVL